MRLSQLTQRRWLARVTLCLLLGGLSGCPDLGERYAAEELWLATPSAWDDVEPIFTQRCVACHGAQPAAGATFSLNTYERASHWAERIRRRVLLSNDMPPGGLSDSRERDTLARWLAQGAPGPRDELAGTEGGMLSGEEAGALVGGEGGEAGQGGGAPLSLGWSDVSQLFDIYCNTCHADPPTGGAPFPLIGYSVVSAYLERIQVRSIERRDMPPGGIQDPDDLALLKRWLAEGGPE